MLWIAATAAAVAVASPTAAADMPRGVVAQATATVRIVSGVRLDFSAKSNRDAPPARRTTLTADGTSRPARLIEFQ